MREVQVGAPQGDLFETIGDAQVPAPGASSAKPGHPSRAQQAHQAQQGQHGHSQDPGLAVPDGWTYRAEFMAPDEEAALLRRIGALPLHAARYKAYTAKRRIASFGTEYDFDRNRLLPGDALPAWLEPLRARCAEWVGIAPEAFSSALVAEYAPGTPLGWHRDVPDFELVVGVSLGTTARMRMRRYPPLQPKKADVISIELAPRSAYVLRDAARWGWQHSIAPTPALRHSITFRTRVDGGARAAPVGRDAPQAA